jgi:hypothetical protein
MPLIVPLNELDFIPKRKSRKKIRNILEDEGQIVPLALDAGLSCVEWFGEEYVAAARDLGWQTILITWPGEG